MNFCSFLKSAILNKITQVSYLGFQGCKVSRMFSYSQLLRVFLQKISSMNQSFSFELIENRPWDARENFQKFQNITKNWNKNGETPYSKNEKMFYLKIRIIRHSCGTSISHTVCQNISDHNWSNQHDSDKINDACIRKRFQNCFQQKLWSAVKCFIWFESEVETLNFESAFS